MKTKTYNFRGNDVFIAHDSIRHPLDVGREACMCSFIPADLPLMIKFLSQVNQYANGEIQFDEIEEVEVN